MKNSFSFGDIMSFGAFLMCHSFFLLLNDINGGLLLTNISKERSINIYLCANEQEGVFFEQQTFLC